MKIFFHSGRLGCVTWTKGKVSYDWKSNLLLLFTHLSSSVSTKVALKRKPQKEAREGKMALNISSIFNTVTSKGERNIRLWQNLVTALLGHQRRGAYLKDKRKDEPEAEIL